MKFVKYIGILLLVVIALGLFFVTYSSKFVDYTCQGKFASHGEIAPKTIKMTMQHYRDWVRIWNDTDGTMRVEISPGENYDYQHLESIGFFMDIYETNSSKTMSGRFSYRNHAIHLETPGGVYEGICRESEE